MLEYDQIENDNSIQSDSEVDASETSSVSSKTGHFGFTSDAQERLWMDQVQKECVRGITNRI